MENRENESIDLHDLNRPNCDLASILGRYYVPSLGTCVSIIPVLTQISSDRQPSLES